VHNTSLGAAVLSPTGVVKRQALLVVEAVGTVEAQVDVATSADRAARAIDSTDKSIDKFTQIERIDGLFSCQKARGNR
jgi:hypothetical protein